MKKKSLFLFCLLVFVFITGVKTVSAKEPTLCNREELKNNGVNKSWTITDKNIGNVKKTPCVDASEKIYDFQGVLTDEEYQKLQVLIGEYIEKTHMDIVIVIDSLPYTNDHENEDYAADFYDYNDFGLNFDKYSGTLLFRNTYEKDPYYDIYTFGDAQLYYDYNRLQVILDGIYDNLHEKNYYDGFKQYIEYLDQYYEKGYEKNNYIVDKDGTIHQKYTYPFLMVCAFSFVISLVTILIFVKKNKMVMKATKAEQYLSLASVKITNRQDKLVGTHTSSYTTSSDSGGGFHSGGGGGFSSSIGSSGGGHSSGGGRHG